MKGLNGKDSICKVFAVSDSASGGASRLTRIVEKATNNQEGQAITPARRTTIEEDRNPHSDHFERRLNFLKFVSADHRTTLVFQEVSAGNINLAVGYQTIRRNIDIEGIFGLATSRFSIYNTEMASNNVENGGATGEGSMDIGEIGGVPVTTANPNAGNDAGFGVIDLDEKIKLFWLELEEINGQDSYDGLVAAVDKINKREYLVFSKDFHHPDRTC